MLTSDKADYEVDPSIIIAAPLSEAGILADLEFEANLTLTPIRIITESEDSLIAFVTPTPTLTSTSTSDSDTTPPPPTETTAPTATPPPATTIAPTATPPPPTTVVPSATPPPPTTVVPTATQPPPTTVVPSATQPPPTTVVPSATPPPPTTVVPTATQPPATTAAPTRTSEPSTNTPQPATNTPQPATNTPQPTTPTATSSFVTVAFSADSYQVDEGDGVAEITVILNQLADQPVTVEFSTADGTALAGLDYGPTNGTVTIPVGQLSAIISVPIFEDALDENQETVQLTLSNPVGASLTDPRQATLFINDNDDPPSVQFSAAAYQVAENANQAVITMTLTAASGLTVTATYSTINNSALANLDYIPTQSAVVIPPGQLRQTSQIPIINDFEIEGNESFSLTLLNSINAIIGSPSRASVTIVDDDLPTVQFSRDNYQIIESGGQAIFTVTLSQPISQPVSVVYATTSGTATPDVDYEAIRSTLIFAPNQTIQTFSIPIIDDNLQENDETVKVLLEQADGATIGTPNEATLTIIDDDGPPTVQFAQADYTVSESGASALITVTISPPSGLPVSVDYATSDGSADSSDYLTTLGTLNFAPNQGQAIFIIPINQDSLAEGDETINLTLSNPVNAQLGLANATLTIIDDDAFPTVSFEQNTYFVNEAETVALITITLNIAPAITGTVQFDTFDDTATAGQDYTAVSRLLTFGPGQTVQTVTIPILQDMLHEANEAVLLQLSTPTGLVLATTPTTARLRITNADPQPIVQLSSSIYQVGEGDGQVVLTATLNGLSGLPVTVGYQSSDNTALAGLDYAAVSSTVVIPAGQQSATFTVTIFEDNEVEGTESFSITLIGPPVNATLGTPTQATVMIIDNDTLPKVQFTQSSYNVSEDAGLVSIVLELDQPATVTGSVTVATSNGAAQAGIDYTAVNQIVTFTPGQSLLTVTINIIDDLIPGPSIKPFLVQLSSPTNLDLGLQSLTIVNIQENDIVFINFNPDKYTVSEAAGNAILTVTLSTAAPFPISVDYSTSDNQAVSGSDYTATNGTLTFSPGQTALAIPVQILDDADTEPTEEFFMTLSNPVSATLGFDAVANIDIVDNDTPAVSLTAGNYTVDENAGQRVVSVTLSFPSPISATVAYSTSNGTALMGIDYRATNGVLLFNPGETLKIIQIPITDNLAINADKTFGINLGSPVNAKLGPFSTAVITITDDDRPFVQFANASLALDESNGPAIVEVTLSKPASATITVDYTTNDGSAIAGDDYTATAGTLVFAPNQISQTIAISIIDDSLNEPDESFSIVLSNPTNAILGSPISTTVTIQNDDISFVEFASSTYNVSEGGGSVTVEVILTTAAVNTVAVDYTTSDQTASAGSDYTLSSGTLTFLPGVTSALLIIGINEDKFVEGDEQFLITLSNPTNASLGPTSSTQVTIQDNDLPTVAFAVSAISVNENAGPATINVVLDQPSPNTVQVNYTMTDGSATGGTDYDNTGGTVTFSPGDTSEPINIPIINDSDVDGGESFTINLSSPTSANLGTPNSATVFIIDDDVAAPLPECYGVNFTLTESIVGDQRVIRGEVINTLANPITIREVNTIVYETGTFSETIDSNVAGTGTIHVSTSPNFVAYTFIIPGSPSNRVLAAGASATFTATYRKPLADPIFAPNGMDYFFLRYFEGNNPSEVVPSSRLCSHSQEVSPTGPSGSLTVTIDSPTAYQIVNNNGDATFGASTNIAIGGSTGWANFKIVHVATGEIIWNIRDDVQAYCAFGGNASCNPPNTPGFNYDWNDLTDGLYRLDVTVRDVTGNVAQDSQFFVIDRP